MRAHLSFGKNEPFWASLRCIASRVAVGRQRTHPGHRSHSHRGPLISPQGLLYLPRGFPYLPQSVHLSPPKGLEAQERERNFPSKNGGGVTALPFDRSGGIPNAEI